MKIVVAKIIEVGKTGSDIVAVCEDGTTYQKSMIIAEDYVDCPWVLISDQTIKEPKWANQNLKNGSPLTR